MRIRIPAVLILLLFLALAPAGQPQSSVSGPTLGYLWDPTAPGLRPILGVPGSATLGPILDFGVAMSYAEVSPGQDYGLAVAAESPTILVIDLPPAQTRVRPVDTVAQGLNGVPDRIIQSPTGAAAGLYYEDPPSLLVMVGLPRGASVTDEFQLSGLPTPVTSVAINDFGDTVLAATSRGVYAIAAQRRVPLLVSPAEQVSAIGFLENSGDALLADDSRNELVLVRDVAGAAERVVLASEKDGVSKLVAVAAYDNNRRVLAASGATLAMLDMVGGSLAMVPCRCNISGLHRLRGNSVFRLNAPFGGPMFLLDAESAEPRILFVPARPGGRPGSAPAVLTKPQVPRRRR